MQPTISPDPPIGANPSPGLWHRVRDWFNQSPPPGECRVWREVTEPVGVPAYGDAFDFQAHLVLTWSSCELTRDDLISWSAVHTSAAVARVRQYAKSIGRSYQPHQVDEFDRELNAALERREWRFHHDNFDVACRAAARVTVDDRVRESMQPIWQRRIELESQHELDMRRAQLVRERTETWTSILEKLQHNPTSAHAVVLAEESFAEVFRQMQKTRRELAEKVADVLRDAIYGHQQIGAYEMAESFDRALRAFEQQIGLPILTADDQEPSPG